VAAPEHGVPAQRIAVDYAGFDTYDSCARARRVFGVRQAIVVTQTYHLARAVTCAARWASNAVGRRRRLGTDLPAGPGSTTRFASGRGGQGALSTWRRAATGVPGAARAGVDEACRTKAAEALTDGRPASAAGASVSAAGVPRGSGHRRPAGSRTATPVSARRKGPGRRQGRAAVRLEHRAAQVAEQRPWVAQSTPARGVHAETGQRVAHQAGRERRGGPSAGQYRAKTITDRRGCAGGGVNHSWTRAIAGRVEPGGQRPVAAPADQVRQPRRLRAAAGGGDERGQITGARRVPAVTTPTRDHRHSSAMNRRIAVPGPRSRTRTTSTTGYPHGLEVLRHRRLPRVDAP
jgi:hypothetical protein